MYKNKIIFAISPLVFSIFIFVAGGFSKASATEAAAPCLDCASGEGKSLVKTATEIKDVATGATTDQDAYPTITPTAHWLDANFFIDTKPDGKELDVAFKNPSDLSMTNAQLTKINSIYMSFLNQKSLSDALQGVKTSGANLSKDEKLLLLSMVGSRLADGYSAKGQENKDLNAVYLNAVKNKQEGGICGDIHKLLSDVATNLGFEAAGRNTGQWQKSLGQDNAHGHAILHFRDPQTGEYYIQNYSQIYNTRQKNLQAAVDVSTKVLGVISGQSYIETRPGKTHEYVPATAQWVQQQIKNITTFKTDPSAITLKVGPNEQTLAVQVGNNNIKGFVMSSRVNTNDGAYQVSVAGLSARAGVTMAVQSRMVDQVSVASEAYGGGMMLSAPGFDAFKNTYGQGERNTLFFGGKIAGSARLNNTTGKIEVSGINLDSRPSGHGQTEGGSTSGNRIEVKSGVEQKWENLNIKASADRTWAFLPTIEKNMGSKLVTTYDRVGVVYDTSKSDKKAAYLVVGTNVYFLEGVNVSSATAVKNSIKAVVPTDKLGTFTVSADLAKVIDNKSKDPFYDTIPATAFSIDWSKPLNKLAEMGMNLTYAKGNQIQPFGVIGPISPVMGTTDRKVQGMVYVHVRF